MYLASHRGDYLGAHRGDPGLFGSIGKFLGGAARTAAEFIPGPVGSVVRRVTGSSRPVPPPPQIAPMPSRPSGGFAGLRIGGPRGISAGVERYQGTRVQASAPVSAVGGCPKGYRPNKSSYFTKDGTFHPAGSKCVKYRYRNVANGKALKKAIGRTAAFDKMVKNNRKALRALAKI